MSYGQPGRRRPGRRVALIVAAAALVWAVLSVDDWSRDFSSNRAEISEAAKDPGLRPLELPLPADELVDALRAAARRIKSWEYVGEAGHDNVRSMVFVVRSRVLEHHDDVTLRVEDLGVRCRLSGESSSRSDYPDLGRNPRNLRRILAELEAVLGDTPAVARSTAGGAGG